MFTRIDVCLSLRRAFAGAALPLPLIGTAANGFSALAAGVGSATSSATGAVISSSAVGAGSITSSWLATSSAVTSSMVKSQSNSTNSNTS